MPIRIMQGDKLVEKLTVSRSGASVRIAAVKYIVEIGGQVDGISVHDETVTLRRRGREVVKIVNSVGRVAEKQADDAVQPEVREIPKPVNERTYIIPRWERWEIRFDTTNVDTYARQLDCFGIELGAVGARSKNVDYASQLSGAKKTRSGAGSQERRLYMIAPSENRKEFDKTLLRQAGVKINNRLVLQFFPKELEDRLAQIERGFAHRKTNQESVMKTVFALSPKGSGWELFMQEQQYRPRPKETHEP